MFPCFCSSDHKLRVVIFVTPFDGMKIAETFLAVFSRHVVPVDCSRLCDENVDPAHPDIECFDVNRFAMMAEVDFILGLVFAWFYTSICQCS